MSSVHVASKGGWIAIHGTIETS